MRRVRHGAFVFLQCSLLLLGLHGAAWSDLIGYWPMDEGTGDVVGDQSGNGFDGIIVGNPEWTNDGLFGGGLEFFGNQGRVEIDDHEMLRFDIDANFTAMAWIYIPDNPGGGWRGVVNKSRDQAPWWGIWINPENQWVYGENGNHMMAGRIEEGWHHLTIVQDADEVIQYLYLDGEVLDEHFGLEPQNGAGDLWFGGAKNVSEWFIGIIDEVRVYDEALYEEQILEIMAGPPVGPGMPGDFNSNGTLDLPDVEQLSSEIVAATNNATFDLNDDASVNQMDLQIWVKDLKNTWIGDANLDGLFNTADLVTVLASGTYEDNVARNSNWSTGDWNADGEFTSGDLVEALADGGYEQGPRASVSAVPEPTSLGILIGVALGIASIERRRRR